MPEPSHLPTDQPPLSVRDVPERSRYEATLGGGADLAALLTYTRTERSIVLLHTEVQDGFEGRGVGSRLARAVFDGARERGLRVVPKCPFILRWLERHPEQHDVLLPRSDPLPEAGTEEEPEPA